MRGFLILAAIFVLSGCASDPAVTHVGQRFGEHVTLEVVGGATGGCGAAQRDFVRNLPDGTRTGGFFRVPDGKVLVVTDVDWQYVHPSGAAGADKLQIMRLFIQSLVNPSDELRAFESAIVLSSEGEGGASEAMQSGFVVSSAARLCPDVFPGPEGPPSGLQHLILRGYLAETGAS